MASAKLTLAQLKAKLNGGTSPRQLGFKVFGNGSYRRAYYSDKWVVKRKDSYDRLDIKGLYGPKAVKLDPTGACPLSLPPMHLAGKRKQWIIQRRYHTDRIEAMSDFFSQPWVQACRDLQFTLRDGWRPSEGFFYPHYNRLDIHKYNIGTNGQGRKFLFDW